MIVSRRVTPIYKPWMAFLEGEQPTLLRGRKQVTTVIILTTSKQTTFLGIHMFLKVSPQKKSSRMSHQGMTGNGFGFFMLDLMGLDAGGKTFQNIFFQMVSLIVTNSHRDPNPTPGIHPDSYGPIGYLFFYHPPENRRT